MAMALAGFIFVSKNHLPTPLSDFESALIPSSLGFGGADQILLAGGKRGIWACYYFACDKRQ